MNGKELRNFTNYQVLTRSHPLTLAENLKID